MKNKIFMASMLFINLNLQSIDRIALLLHAARSITYATIVLDMLDTMNMQKRPQHSTQVEQNLVFTRNNLLFASAFLAHRNAYSQCEAAALAGCMTAITMRRTIEYQRCQAQPRACQK